MIFSLLHILRRGKDLSENFIKKKKSKKSKQIKQIQTLKQNCVSSAKFPHFSSQSFGYSSW